MDHAKKFVLMPMDRAQHFSEDHVSELDKEMQTILSKKISDPEKATLYLQTLQKYVKFPEVNQAKPVTLSTDIVENVLESAPVKHKNVANNILLFLESHPDVFSWNADKELILQGRVLPKTNIELLISHLLRNKKSKPLGFDQFKLVLEENNFPKSFVKNSHLREKQQMYALRRKPMYKKGSWAHL